MKKKQKATYSIWQNINYIIKYTWIRDKLVLCIIFLEIFLNISISLLFLFLPKTVVSQITDKVDVGTLIITVVSFTFATIFLQLIQNYLSTSYNFRRSKLRISVSHDILLKCITTDYANLDDQKFNDRKQKATDLVGDTTSSTENIYYTFSELGTSIIGFIIYLILLVSINPIILIITIITAIFGVLSKQWAAKWQYDHDNESVEFNKRLWYINSVGNNYSMAKDVRLFPIVNWLNDVYKANIKLALSFSYKVQIRYFIANIINCVGTFMREGIAYAYLIWQVLFSNLSADDFILLFAAIGGFSGYIINIFNGCITMFTHNLNYCRLREFLDFPENYKYDNGNPVEKNSDVGYTFEFKNVSFCYPGSNKNTLENINLTIKPGEKLAIVGLNGAGKSTLVKLLCGLYNPTKGEILLNGKNIQNYNRKDYYTLFTAVFQEFSILPVTIAENIAQLTNEDEKIDIKKVYKCIELSDFDKKIAALPEGIFSMMVKNVNDDAVELSGGETQKLLLSRALYKNAHILVLDEPTAALDPIAESKLYSRYNELSEGKSSIYISHRLASTRFCDRIILIDNNNIIECGTHEELIKLNGKYAELFEIQSKYYKDEIKVNSNDK